MHRGQRNEYGTGALSKMRGGRDAPMHRCGYDGIDTRQTDIVVRFLWALAVLVALQVAIIIGAVYAAISERFSIWRNRKREIAEEGTGGSGW